MHIIYMHDSVARDGRDASVAAIHFQDGLFAW